MEHVEQANTRRLERVAENAPTRVLIVEDSILTAQQLCESISNISPEDISCTVVSTEHDAMRWIEDMPPDLVVLDLRLKEGSGFQVLKRIKSLHPKPTTIVATNYALPQYREFALLTGADYFIDKALQLPLIPSLIESQFRERVSDA